MPETAKITQIGHENTVATPEQPQEHGKNQLPGESPLWFHRYLLYRDLGHKRSLRAAVAKERETMSLVKSVPLATKGTLQQKKAGDKLSNKAPTPTISAINVPGSWKNAAKVYHWSERALASDAYNLRRFAESVHAQMGDSYANKFKRIELLDSLIKRGARQVTEGIETHLYLGYVKQLAALVKQMEAEMSQVEDDEMVKAISAYWRNHREALETGKRVAMQLY